MNKIKKQKPRNKTERIRSWRENIPDFFHGSYRRNYDKAMTGKSLRAAVDSKCLDCMCWQAAEVRKCTIVTCPLHPYRPYSEKNQQSHIGDNFQTE